MLYKPKFCCECGEPIERINWSLLTDRRFCQSCEVDYKINALFYRAVIAACILFGIFGLGMLLKKPERPLNLASANNSPNTNKNAGSSTGNTQISNNADVKSFAQISETNPVAPSASLNNPTAEKQNVKIQKVENQTGAPQEVIYYCGAKTKKGTLCTHRVKGGGRCWQHAGLPAMLPQEKLVASR